LQFGGPRNYPVLSLDMAAISDPSPSFYAPSSIGDLCIKPPTDSPGIPSIKYFKCDTLSKDGAITGSHSMAYTVYKPEKPSKDAPNRFPVLCVHGLTRNGSDFDILARQLVKQGHEVICVDVVGRRWSDRLSDPSGYGYPQYVSDMRAFLESLGWSRFHWIGTSMGGLIGIMALNSGLPAKDAGSKPTPTAVSLTLNDIGPVVSKSALIRIASYVGTPPQFTTIAAGAGYLGKVYSGFGPCSKSLQQRMAMKMLRIAPSRPASTDASGSGVALSGVALPDKIASQLQREIYGDSKEASASSLPEGAWDDSMASGLISRVQALASDAIKELHGSSKDEDGKLELAYDPRISAGFPKAEDIKEDIVLWPIFETLQAKSLFVLRGATSDILSDDCLRQMMEKKDDGSYKRAPGVSGIRDSICVDKVGHVPALLDAAQCKQVSQWLEQAEGWFEKHSGDEK